MQSDEYVGIPYKLNGTGREEGVDCLGLCRLFYMEHGWGLDFRDNGEPYTYDNMGSHKNWKRLVRYLNRNMKHVKRKKLQFGDLIVFNVRGDAHLGIYIQDDYVLAQMVPCKEGETSSVLYHKNIWDLGFKWAFRRKEETNAGTSSKDAGGEG